MPLAKTGHYQRIQHIVRSYQLGGNEPARFEACLAELLARIPPPLIELALVETLVRSWLKIPLIRGTAFLERMCEVLETWASQMLEIRLTPMHFEVITGLDPNPIFNYLDAALQDWAVAADNITQAIALIPLSEAS